MTACNPEPPIDLHAGHRHRQSGIECDDASDGRRLTVGVAVTEDDVLHRLARNSGAVQQPGQRGHPELNGTQ
jgi:hypothetical protein